MCYLEFGDFSLLGLFLMVMVPWNPGSSSFFFGKKLIFFATVQKEEEKTAPNKQLHIYAV